MKLTRQLTQYFSKTELLLWLSSVLLILISFGLFDRKNFLTLTASLIGVTSLIFNAKGNPIGQFFMIIFSLFYGFISYSYSYYGEMITYLGMTMPMAIFSLVSWLKHPYHGNHAEVTIDHISRKETRFMWILTILITIIFYFLLSAFHTVNLSPSTLSVTTSFLAAYLTFRRNPFYAIAYAANDIILILLWILASMENSSYLSVTVCFIAFLANDIYGFINWRHMEKSQTEK